MSPECRSPTNTSDICRAAAATMSNPTRNLNIVCFQSRTREKNAPMFVLASLISCKEKERTQSDIRQRGRRGQKSGGKPVPSSIDRSLAPVAFGIPHHRHTHRTDHTQEDLRKSRRWRKRWKGRRRFRPGCELATRRHACVSPTRS